MKATQTGPDQGKRAQLLRLGLYLRESKARNGSTVEVESQEDEGHEWADDNNATIPPYGVYIDNDLSASDFSTKPRSDYFRLISDIKAGRLDAVWLWSTSRSDRKTLNFATFIEHCRKASVKLVVGDRIFDLENPIDLQSLLNSAVNDEVFSVQLSKNVKRGMKKQAKKGRPHSQTTYGYRREYDKTTGEFIEQVADRDTAPIVREIISSIAKGTDLRKMKATLEARDIPSPTGKQTWDRTVIRGIAMNKAYIGIRVHRPTKVVEVEENGETKRKRVLTGEVREYPDAWPALVDEETFWKAQNLLSDPKRKSTRHNRATHLLSYVARCECGQWVNIRWDLGRRKAKLRTYVCEKRHSMVKADELDRYVRLYVDEYLARRDVQAYLAAGMANDAAAIAARTEVQRLRAKLTENKEDYKAERIDRDEYIEFRDDLKEKIAEAEERADKAAMPPILRAGAVDWSDLANARRMVAEIVDIRLHPAGKGRRNVPVEERVTITPKIGPDAA